MEDIEMIKDSMKRYINLIKELGFTQGNWDFCPDTAIQYFKDNVKLVIYKDVIFVYAFYKIKRAKFKQFLYPQWSYIRQIWVITEDGNHKNYISESEVTGDIKQIIKFFEELD